MGFTVPLFIPLQSGLDLSQEGQLGSGELHEAHNVEYALDGAIRGRPSRSAAEQFVVRDPASTYGTLAAQDFANTGFVQRGMLRLRDAAGERAALAADGRLFTNGDGVWMDRGPFACAKVERLFNFQTNLDGTQMDPVALDFGTSDWIDGGGSGPPIFTLLNADFSVDRYQEVSGSTTGDEFASGNSAKCGTTTAIARCSGGSSLYFYYRTAGGDSITRVTLATDCRTPTGDGDAPSICADFDATHFFVAYRTTTANVFKVLKVAVTGTIAATYTSAAVGGLTGIWVSNATVAGNRVYVAFTDSSGITIRQLDMTTMADLTLDESYAAGGGTVGLDCVVGVYDDETTYWAYRVSHAVGTGEIAVGYLDNTSGTMVLIKRYLCGGASINAAINWAICHQPVRVNDEMYLTLAASTGSSASDFATWISLNIKRNPFNKPILVARGATQATVPYQTQPASATVVDDGWVFPTLDWSRFTIDANNGLTGSQASLGLNRVTMSGVRSAQAGESTIFSGSVPHVVSRGQCAEMGFPFLAGVPGIDVQNPAVGGTVPVGDYGVVACWRWTDEAGQIHRSAPSIIRTITIGPDPTVAHTIRVSVTNPWLSEKDYGNLQIEVYCTDTDSTADGLHYLQSTTAVDYSDAYTVVDIDAAPVTTSENLYADAQFGHYHVPADGGIAALGRRIWVASGSNVYASKLLLTGHAAAWSDEGGDGIANLYLTLPAGAGRITSLETIDDKLVVFCKRGVYIIQDGGPDNTGAGPDFATPMRLSDLGIAGPRSSASTDIGVVFCTPLDATDPLKGGPWVIDRQLTLTERKYLGRGVAEYFRQDSEFPVTPEVAWLPEKQQVFITAPDDTLVVMDARVGKWATWDAPTFGSLQSIACVSGALWTLHTEPAPFDGAPGSDTGAVEVTMSVTTSHLSANGKDGLGWARVRSVSVLGADGTAAHDLSYEVTEDSTRLYEAGPIAMATPSVGTKWPTSRQAHEYRLPVQKCATIQVRVIANPATATWAAIRLDVQPLPPRAPAGQRS